jgi:CubicO group peptidase (beta-lactamase class C family)
MMTLVWLSVAETPLSSARSAELADEVRKTAKEAIDSGNVVGVSIGIALGDEILLADGYGFADLESSVPATAQTVYRIGSITKQFTAAAILQLAEQEKVALDDPLTKYLPEYPTGDHPVTIRHLLQHTSGIQSFTDLPSYRRLMRHDASHDEMIDRFKDLPFHFEPGEQFRYCNSGYYLLGVILESAAGVPYEQYLQDNVFDPLCLEQTVYDRTRRVVPDRASGYRHGDDGFENAPYLSMTQPFSAGALASTVTDLIRWQRALVSHQLLTEGSYELMTAKGVRSNGEPIDYGLGLSIRKSDGRKTIGHGGGINGFRSNLTYYPESDHTIVVLANSESAQPGQISRRVVQHLFASTAPNRTVTISPTERDKALAEFPDIHTFAANKSDRFLVDLDVVRTGHPYRGENAERPHTGGHVYFALAEEPIPPNDVDQFPAIYAVADGVIGRIDYSFRLREMFEPALDRRVANYRYGIGLSFAALDGKPVDFHYSIEPFVDPGDEGFYDRFILVKPGQRVKKGDIIARMYLPENRELAKKSHIHFNLNGGQDHRFMAPAIFSDDIVKRFHSTWRRSGRGDDAHIPPCLGYELAPHENPFGTGAKKML